MLVRSNHKAFRGPRAHIENTRRADYDAAIAIPFKVSTTTPRRTELVVFVNQNACPRPILDEASIRGRGPLG